MASRVKYLVFNAIDRVQIGRIYVPILATITLFQIFFEKRRTFGCVMLF